MFVSNTIRLLLDGIGRSEEYEFYLEKFQSARSPCFSILVPDLESLENGGEALLFNLDSLVRLGLCPAVLLTGPRAGEMLNLLVNGRGRDVPRRVVRVDVNDIAGAGEKIAAAAHAAKSSGAYVVLLCAAPTPVCLRVLMPLTTRRMLFIRMRGSLKEADGGEVTLYRVRKNVPPVTPEDQAMRAMALEMLEGASEPLHIAVTSPFSVLKEIFTVKGAGTILRPGSNILKFQDLARVDADRLRELLRESFGRNPRDFADMLKRFACFYIEENYRGAILLEPHPAGLYLSKFAVDTQARGDGVAQELWETASGEHSALFWRSRRGNAVNRWYNRLAHGRQDHGPWTIFWRGVSYDALPDIIDFCAGRGPDFEDAE